MAINIYEVLFTLLNSTLLILLVIFVCWFFKKRKRRQKEIDAKFNEILEEIRKLKNN